MMIAFIIVSNYASKTKQKKSNNMLLNDKWKLGITPLGYSTLTDSYAMLMLYIFYYITTFDWLTRVTLFEYHMFLDWLTLHICNLNKF